MSKKYISNKDETVRMFESDFMEFFSRVHWSVPLWIYIPVISFFLFKAVFIYQIHWLSIIALFIAGLIFWTLTEYVLHRFIFHYQPKSKIGKRFHFIFHGVHHDYPKDSKRLVMPPSISIPLASFFYLLFWLILGVEISSIFFSGFIAGYLFYDITHYAVHHFNVKNKFWLSIKNYHMLHHYKYDDLGFGVSQPLWDYIFGTTYPKKES